MENNPKSIRTKIFFYGLICVFLFLALGLPIWYLSGQSGEATESEDYITVNRQPNTEPEQETEDLVFVYDPVQDKFVVESEQNSELVNNKESVSFAEAFSRARSQLGSNTTFVWNGEAYSTNLAEEEVEKIDQTKSTSLVYLDEKFPELKIEYLSTWKLKTEQWGLDRFKLSDSPSSIIPLAHSTAGWQKIIFTKGNAELEVYIDFPMGNGFGSTEISFCYGKDDGMTAARLGQEMVKVKSSSGKSVVYKGNILLPEDSKIESFLKNHQRIFQKKEDIIFCDVSGYTTLETKVDVDREVVDEPGEGPFVRPVVMMELYSNNKQELDPELINEADQIVKSIEGLVLRIF